MSWFSRRTVAVLALGAALAGCNNLNQANSPGRTPIGSPAPETAGKDLDDKPLNLSEYRGRVVMLSFWATWCGYCVELFPDEKTLVQQYEGRPFALLGVNVDHEMEAARRMQEGKHLTWRSFWDGPGKISAAYGVDGYPFVFLIDHKGVVRFIARGLPDQKALQNKLEELVAEAEVPK
ncbi:MAG TPA: TlpA disulfide reductase family protein [Gemmataceae bacterium]|nr:TlpA disulfide reductase family protein [Gemmataceae bacterium]